MKPVWRVALPRGAEPPYRVFVNGVPQREGSDYRVEGRELVFDRRLAKEGRLGFWRWTSIFLGLIGTYRQNDSVDVQYRLHGQERHATALEIIPPPEEKSQG
ncbi:MAG: hypothetical protein ACJ76V_09915 [Thermoleophilaceae bacterium]